MPNITEGDPALSSVKVLQCGSMRDGGGPKLTVWSLNVWFPAHKGDDEASKDSDNHDLIERLAEYRVLYGPDCDVLWMDRRPQRQPSHLFPSFEAGPYWSG